MGQAQGLLFPARISFVSFISLQTRYDLWGRFQSRRVSACYDDGTLALAALRLPARLHNPCHRREGGLRLLLWQIASPAGMRMPKQRVRVLQRPNELVERSPRCWATMWLAQYSPEQAPPGAHDFDLSFKGGTGTDGMLGRSGRFQRNDVLDSPPRSKIWSCLAIANSVSAGSPSGLSPPP